MLDLFKLTMNNEKHHEDRTCISHYVDKVITRKNYFFLRVENAAWTTPTRIKCSLCPPWPQERKTEG